MNILYASTEIIGVLPKSTSNISAVLPKYRHIPKVLSDKMVYIMHFYINIGWRSQYCGIYKTDTENGTVYFVENEYYFGEGSAVYAGEAFENEKYSYFARGVLEMRPKIGILPDLIHTLDLKSAKICTMLEEHYRENEYYSNIKCVATLHNLKYRAPDFFYAPDTVRFWQGDTYSGIPDKEYIYEN